MNEHSPLLLLILDGWGYSEQIEYNAIAAAKTPNWNKLWQQCPHALLDAAGGAVGLPKQQMGNSEVGHMHIGAGRVIDQDLTRIDRAIKNGEFASNNLLQQQFANLKNRGKTLHLIGLLSPGGIHSHEKHIFALIESAAKAGLNNIAVHAILDGRDTPPSSAADSLEKLQALLDKLQCGKIASIIGRYYAMDRDHRWQRTKQAYDLYTKGEAAYITNNAQAALQMAYFDGQTDEFVEPIAIEDKPGKPITIQAGDTVLFMNFRADRARQLTRALTDQNFNAFAQNVNPKNINFISLKQYAAAFDNPVIFSPLKLQNTLGEYIATQGLHQLRIAETEKYAHVTFFFNGGKEPPFANEDRELIASPKVATYDLQPEMSAPEVTEKMCSAIASGKYSLIVANFANPDMVGHTGKFNAAVKAIECIDDCLGKLATSLQQHGGEMIITADHGNVECLYDPKHDQAHTAHTHNPVPFVYMGRAVKLLQARGSLTDIAPTILNLLGLTKPTEMTGNNLLEIIQQ